jgi:hypothetical protein
MTFELLKSLTSKTLNLTTLTKEEEVERRWNENAKKRRIIMRLIRENMAKMVYILQGGIYLCLWLAQTSKRSRKRGKERDLLKKTEVVPSYELHYTRGQREVNFCAADTRLL